MVTGALVVAIVAAAMTAPAEDLSLEAEADRVEKVTALNRQALAEVDRGALTAARKHLIEAEQLAVPLRSHPIVARTALHLGAVEVLSGAPQKRVDELFRKAVEVQPDIQMTKQLATRADLMAACASLEKARCGLHHPSVWTCPWKEDDADSDPPAKVATFVCPARDEVPSAKPVVIRCAANPALRVERATLYYGAARTGPKLTALKMRRNERGWWTATIPGDRVRPKSMVFYAEALDADGKRVASMGTDASPQIFLVETPDTCFCAGPDLEQPSAARP